MKKRRPTVRFVKPINPPTIPRVLGIKHPLVRKAVDELREHIITAHCHADQLDDDQLEGVEELTIRHITELLALALKMMDGVESLRAEEPAQPG